MATKQLGWTSNNVMKHSTLRACTTIFVVLLAFIGAASAQEELVKFHPIGEPRYCKGCGHAGLDYWKLTIRLQNISGTNLVLYGDVIGGEFDALNYIQRRNSNTCEWEYGTGETKRRVPWSKMRDHERVPRIFKPDEVIDTIAGFGVFEHGNVIRFTAFLAKSAAVEPTEIFSVSYKPKLSDDPTAASYEVVDDSCSPLCTIGLTESPKIAGIHLSMNIEDFRLLYPKVKISTHEKRPDLYQTAYILDFRDDLYSLFVNFINGKVERIEPKFRSLDKVRERPDSWQRISSTIGLPSYWPPYMSKWKCRDFVVEVTLNDNPDISIHTPEFIRVRNRINNEALKKK